MFWRVIRWALIGLPVLAFTAVSYPLAPLVVLFEHNGWLPHWLRWFQTYDHDLYGGKDWQADHPRLYKTRRGMILWLWRNPAGTFSYTVAGVWPWGKVDRQGDSAVTNTPNGHSGCCLTTCTNAWLFNHVRQWGASSRCLRIVMGWKLYDEQDMGQCRDPLDGRSKPAQWVLVCWPLAHFDNQETWHGTESD